VDLKGLQEVLQHLLFSFFAALDVGVVCRIVNALQVGVLEGTILVPVHLGEGLLDERPSEVVELSTNGEEEFIDGKGTVLVLVEKSEEVSALVLAYLDPKVVHGLPELLDVKGA